MTVQRQLHHAARVVKAFFHLGGVGLQAVNLLQQKLVQPRNHPVLPGAAPQALGRAVLLDAPSPLHAVEGGVDVAFDAVVDAAALIRCQHPLLLHLLKIDVGVRLPVQTIMPHKAQNICGQRLVFVGVLALV